MKINKILSTVFSAGLLLCTTSQSFAQLTVNTTTYTTPTAAQSLVQNILLGTGVTASNITFTPASTSTSQLGFFNGINSNIGLDSGIVMSTGHVKDLSPAGGGTPFTNTTTNTDLLTLANSVPPLIGQGFTVSSVNDVAILEFDFVPAADTVKFRYVFGSDEYTTYINTQFNDVFGFFISGPGINGPFSNNSQNIAVVPGTNPPLPITISSVQPALNGQYYISNTFGSTVTLNGFTTVFTAVSPVICGQTYHIRLAIADGSDSSLDSGVFLEASSFTSNAVNVISATLTGDSTVVEGCSQGDFVFYRPGSTLDTLSFPITVTGTAIEGVDYNFLPDSITFLPGVNTITLPIFPVNDGIVEGPESIIVSFTQDICGSYLITSSLWIVPVTPLVADVPDTSLVCISSDPVTLTAQYSGGYPPYHVFWNTGEITNSITIIPSTTTTYYYLLTDSCSGMVITDSITVIVPVASPLGATVVNPEIACPGQTSTLVASGTGGFPNYSYIWSLNGTTVSNTSTLTTPALLQDTVYVLTIGDACGSSIYQQNVTVNVVPYVPIVVGLGDDRTVPCPNIGLLLIPEVANGAAPYNFTWSTGAVPIGPGDTAIVQPSTSSTYYLAMSDVCNLTPVVDSVKVSVATYSALIATASPDTSICPKNPVTLSVIADGGAGSYTYLWEDLVSLAPFTGNTALSINPTINYEVTYRVTVTDQCGTSSFDEVKIPLRPDCDVVVPNVVTANGDGDNQFLLFKGLELFPNPKLEVFNRWGNKVYESANYQNNWAPVELNPGVYYFTLDLGTIDAKKGFFQLFK